MPSEPAAVERQPAPSGDEDGGLPPRRPGPSRRRRRRAIAAAAGFAAEHLPHDVHVAVLTLAHLLPQPP